MPPSSETITGIAGETMVWLTAATSMPSVSPTKITFLREPLFPIVPSVLHKPGDDAERSPEFCQLLWPKLPSGAVFEPLTTLLAALDQEPSLLGGVQPHHPVVLWIPLPVEQAFLLQPLSQTRDARGVNLEAVANLSLAYPVLLDEHGQEEPRSRTEAHLTLKGVLHPPEGETQKGHQRAVVTRLLRQHLALLLRMSVIQHLVVTSGFN